MLATRLLIKNSFSNAKTIKNYINLFHPPHGLHTIKKSSTFSLTESLCKRNEINFQSVRHYAKNKDKKKDKGKVKVAVNENQLAEVINVESLKMQMQKAIESLKEDFVKNLSVRSNAGAIEGIRVEFDGKEHTLQELAQVVRKNPKTIIVNMAVFPQAIPMVKKAIEKSGMNLNPQQEGTTLYIPIPKVTTEHREGLAKNAKALFIKYRDIIRDLQMKQIKSIKKKDKLSEDIARNTEQQVITIADGYISQAEKILESKQKELTGKD